MAQLGLDLDPTALAAIERHARLLLAWTTAINLTAIRDPAAVAVRHVLDSLTAVRPLRERGIRSFVDIGSGGGYPALPLAVALPAERALLVESVAKKADFLAAATVGSGLAGRVEVVARRSESVAADERFREAWPAVTARAVAALDELVELGFPLLQPGGVLIAWKSGDIPEELAAARRAADALGGGDVLELSEAAAVPGLEGRFLVAITKHGQTPRGYPRDPALRKRRPW
ncbi:MAG TPA: 16S rRNA (guanine(527)-N(7))-methyltransferase RsmG [Candidatus Limnocylindrales bacterium]